MTRTRAIRCLAACACALAVLAGDAAAATMFPMPGSTSASPFSQISIRGIAPEELSYIAVRGSRTGNHKGTLRSHSDGRGVSFVPSKRFSGGERVTVRTSTPISGGRDGTADFKVAIWPSQVRFQKGIDTVQPGKRRRFRSRPDLAPPMFTVQPKSTPAEPGHVFLSPKTKNDTLQAGPMITDLRGRLIWFKPLPGIRSATDVRVQTYQGRPVITWWEGTSRQGIGTGTLVIVGQDYEPIMRVKVPNGYRADLHEFLITPQNTALLIAYPTIRANLSAEGGSSNGQLVDSVVQEVDLATGSVLFEWHSRGQVPLSDSFIAPERSPRVPWDYVHANSVAIDSDGDLLVSARNTWAVYKLDRQTGRTEWILGGRRSTFKLGKGVRFAWQHDAQRLPDGTLSLFDNSASPAVAKRSRGIAIKLDTGTRRARLVHARTHPRNMLAATQGNYQVFPSGGGLIGWGSQRYATEYDAAGKIIWDARLSVGYESYRAYRFPWVGIPKQAPKVLARRDGGGMNLYVSWNGATDVASWQVLAGDSPSRLAPVLTTPRTGFETHIGDLTRKAYVAVRALDASGAVQRQSDTVRVR